jgi:hypothetical protein
MSQPNWPPPSPGIPPPPAGPWAGWTPPPAPPPREPRAGLGAGLVILMVVTALVAVAAIVVPFAASTSPASSSEAAGSAHKLAAAINLESWNFPSGWQIDSSADGPLSGFLGQQPTSAAPSSGLDHQAQSITSGFEHCLGVDAAHDRIFGAGGVPPRAQVSSPAFASPNESAEAGSVAGVFRSASEVSADVAQISQPRFPDCFGAAIGELFLEGARPGAAKSGLSVGEPQVQALHLSAPQGAAVVGVSVTLPLSQNSTVVPIEIGVVFVGGGRDEATLFTFSAGQAFSSALIQSLASTLAHNVATNGAGTNL